MRFEAILLIFPTKIYRTSRMSFTFRLSLILLSLFVLSACETESNQNKSTSGSKLVELTLGDASVQTEIALTRESQRTGLMYRDSLPEDQGMLFAFDAPQQMSFWMRNTKIPLDIGYFTSDGILREYYPLYPFDENARRSIRKDLSYALEVNQGWFKANGVKIGDKLDLSKLP